MKKVSIFFNSPYLGGAERSIIHQAFLIKNHSHITFYIPRLDLNDKTESVALKYLIKEYFDGSSIYELNFPLSLFSVSRSKKSNNFFSIIILLKLIFFDLKIPIKKTDAIWANGNKIGLVLFLYSIIKFYRGCFIWHFRDYPADQGLLGKIWKLFSIKKTFNFVIISNSNSVSKEIQSIVDNKNLSFYTVYNPSGETLRKNHNDNFKSNEVILSVVSMLAPWKGVHNIIKWSSLYQEKLKELGVKSLLIFGAPIYKTDGEHDTYYEDLIKQKEKESNSLVQFMGLRPPDQIYNKIDILIHPSIKKEPFGRVIIEAWKAHIPVCSTALGGASELIIDQQTGMKYHPDDFEELFFKIKTLITDDEIRNSIIQGGSEKLLEIEKDIKNTLLELIEKEILS